MQGLFGASQPRVWVSDMLGSQRGHAVQWQVCLAHLLRDARYAAECGDTEFSAAFKRLLLRAIAIGRRRPTLQDTTLAQYRADLDRRLDRIIAAIPRWSDCSAGWSSYRVPPPRSPGRPKALRLPQHDLYSRVLGIQWIAASPENVLLQAPLARRAAVRGRA